MSLPGEGALACPESALLFAMLCGPSRCRRRHGPRRARPSRLPGAWSMIPSPADAQVDRPSATAQRCGEVESAIFDLFAQLGASEEQLDFPVLYASAREVWGPRSPSLHAMILLTCRTPPRAPSCAIVRFVRQHLALCMLPCCLAAEARCLPAQE